MNVFELAHPGRGYASVIGIFSSVEKAKEAAAFVLESYREFDGDEDVEPMDFEAEWVHRRETISRGMEVGEPIWFLDYGASGSSLRIRPITIDTGRTGLSTFTV